MRRCTFAGVRSFLLTVLVTVLTCSGWLLFLNLNNIIGQDEGTSPEESESGSGSESESEESEGEGSEGEESSLPEDGEHGGEEEVEINPVSRLTAIVVILFVLILLTIMFEKAKEAIDEMADKIMKPAVQGLFGELTVLGFLAVTTWLFVQAGFFTLLSRAIFGEDEFLVELYEKVHYALFFVMCSFMLQVLRILVNAKRTHQEWQHMELQCQDEKRMKRIIAKPSGRHSEKELLLYYKLRQEFLLDRSVEPPFAPNQQPLPEDFDFSSYLYINLGKACAEVIEVKVSTWGFLALWTVLVYLVALATVHVESSMQWIWLGIGWLGMVGAVAFSYYLDQVKRAFVSANTPTTLEATSGINLNLEEEIESMCLTHDASFSDEYTDQTPDGRKFKADPTLPKWCSVNLDEYLTRRGCITKIACPHKPTRQDTLYWFEKEGNEFHLHAFQTGMISVDIHLATTFVAFSSNLPTGFTELLYILLAVAPFMVIIGNSRRQMKDVTIVGCMGSFRNQVAVAQVLREEKTARAVRAFLVLERMHRHSKDGLVTAKSHGDPKSMKYSPAMDDAAVEVLGKTFDSFDSEGNGAVSRDEIEAMLQRFGANMVAAMDSDSDGSITKEEFILWNLERMMYEEEVTPKARARNLFDMFDINKDGEIGLAEFQAALDAFNMGFTIDEIGMVVMEVSGEGGISLTLEHFEELVERFYPEVLESADASTRRVGIFRSVDANLKNKAKKAPAKSQVKKADWGTILWV